MQTFHWQRLPASRPAGGSRGGERQPHKWHGGLAQSNCAGTMDQTVEVLADRAEVEEVAWPPWGRRKIEVPRSMGGLAGGASQLLRIDLDGAGCGPMVAIAARQASDEKNHVTNT